MNKWLYIIVGVVSLSIGWLVFYKYTQIAAPEHALYYQQPRDIKSFTLTDHQGDVFNNSRLQGKWSWVFFGYTSCPDVCPTTLQELNFIYDELQAIDPNNQVLLVSVDPKRDSQDKLNQYIGYFNSAFVALRGEHSTLFPFARNLGLMYAIVDEETAQTSSYLVDHSASIVLINPEGEIAAIFKPKFIVGQPPAINGNDLVSDFEKIVKLNG
ncbi:SCO family protein [Thalassotalea sp. PLHSN55]|uniref:SCO family protein n=1 Tax=Thalassotalea sp. PLHSN55 TaxID=3435888 RepID=UPI003F873FE4